MRGTLTVIAGCMFAGKTSMLIQIARQTQATVFKPSFDTRYAETECVSHDGECVPAHAISSIHDIANVGSAGPYCIDEIQFMTGDRYEGDFVKDVTILLDHGVDIYAFGLDLSATGEPFDITARLLALADNVSKIASTCFVCNGKATKTLKTGGHDDIIELGANDIYEARCNAHWTIDHPLA